MLETEQQRRWWFATHPEFSSKGSGKKSKRHKDEGEPEKISPEAVDAYGDERLAEETDPVIIQLLKSTKYWFGTEHALKSPAKQAAAWGDEEDSWDDDEPADEFSADLAFLQSPSRHPAASRDSYDRYEDALDRADAYADWLTALYEKPLVADPHTLLDLFPYRRLATAPVEVLRSLLKNMAEGAVVKAAKKGRGGWKVGTDPLTRTAKGIEPSWTTQYRREWKNEAASEGAMYKWGAENIERMKRGLAPQRVNPRTGELESMELHHSPHPRRDGGKEFIKVWPDEHARVDKYRRLKKR